MYCSYRGFPVRIDFAWEFLGDDYGEMRVWGAVLAQCVLSVDTWQGVEVWLLTFLVEDVVVADGLRKGLISCV